MAMENMHAQWTKWNEAKCKAKQRVEQSDLEQVFSKPKLRAVANCLFNGLRTWYLSIQKGTKLEKKKCSFDFHPTKLLEARHVVPFSKNLFWHNQSNSLLINYMTWVLCNFNHYHCKVMHFHPSAISNQTNLPVAD